MESNHSKRIRIDGCQLANKKVIGTQELTVFNEEESRRELAAMVILHDYPISMVEHVGFRRFVASLQPRFHMISRNTLTNDIMKIYKDERAKHYKLFDKLKCRIAITTDMWTSNDSKKGFMAILAHYIDDSWVLHRCVLRFMYVDAPHTAEALSEDFIEALMEWNIDRKLSTITTIGNCTTNDVVLDHLVEEFPKKDMLLDGKVLHIRSYAHILNLIIEDGLGVVTGAIERIRESVVYWTASPARVQKFKTCARVLCNIDSTKELSLDCKTRWDSTYLMLETAIMYKDVFPKVQFREEHYRNLPTDEDWVNATEICGKLNYFYQATEIFSGTLYPTSNFYFPKICNIKLKLNEWVKSPNSMTQDMAEKMLEKYDKYLDTCLIMTGVAAVLDPRYKMKLIEFFLPLIYGERSQSKIDEIRCTCYELLSDYKSRAASMKGDSSSITTRGSLGTMMSCGISSAIGAPKNDFDLAYDQFVASRYPAKASLTFELDIYLEEIVLPRTQDFDVLSWWKTNGVKYPNLQIMARDILAIQNSTYASECAFSTNRILLGPLHNGLHPSIVEALMCSRTWLRK